MSTRSENIAKAAKIIKSNSGDKIWIISTLLGIDPTEAQKIWAQRAILRENVLVTGNRWGKSEITAAIDIADALTLDGWDRMQREMYTAMKEPYNLVNLAFTQDQARIVWLKGYRRLTGMFGDALLRDVKF